MAFAKVEQANIALEDLILDELDLVDSTGSVDGIVAQMNMQGLMLSMTAWESASAIMMTKGFYGMLDAFNSDIDHLDQMTHDLIVMVRANEPAAQAGSLSEVLEGNTDGNFKREFARLYSAWAAFQQFFLSSSIISTEAWYRFTGVGSLVDDQIATKMAA